MQNKAMSTSVFYMQGIRMPNVEPCCAVLSRAVLRTVPS